MIDIRDKKDCCGCESCKQICSKECISMSADSEGFSYPKVDTATCINCGACENVCPIHNEIQGVLPDEVIAAKSINEDLRENSSSGGIFSLLAESVIEEGGIVFGAIFDNDWSVKHSSAETSAQLLALRTSKYLQSKIGNVFKEVREQLRNGRQVMFCGTPCQVAALKLFPKRDYQNLLLVDFVCHGVPSPKVWKHYLETITQLNDITNISFRSKSNGWKRYCIKLVSLVNGSDNCNGQECDDIKCTKLIEEPFDRNKYMQTFLSNVNLRPSCYSCPAKGQHSAADITLGDFWGINKIRSDFDDDRGTSLIIPRTEKGNSALTDILFEGITINTSEATLYNPSILESVNVPPYREYFFNNFKGSQPFSKAYNAVYSSSLINKIRRRLWLKFAKG